jgi:hypothetical protein
MNKQRYLQIASLATQAAQRLNRYGSIRRSLLPEVTLTEHHWLIAKAEHVAGYTRCPGAPDDWIESTDLPASAKRPVIREIWVGSRSMSSVGQDDTPEGFACAQDQQEQAAELTELQTVLYQDPIRYEEWVKEEVERIVARAYELSVALDRRLAPAQLNEARIVAEAQVRQDSANMGFIEDPETGEYRPIRNGDIIQIAWGSNENLDNLYLEEASDPRSEEGSLYRELLRDQIRANSDFEQDLLNDRSIVVGSQDDEYAENDLHIRRIAYYKADRVIARETAKHGREPSINWQQSVRDLAVKKTKALHSRVQMDDGKVIAGQFNTAKDIFDEQEFNIRRLEECIRHNRVKERPKASDWNLLRSVGTRLARSKGNRSLARAADAIAQEQAERKARLIKARPELASVLGS